MTKRCGDSATSGAVDITCNITKCAFSSRDTASHVTEVVNNRTGSLYQLEVCAASMTGSVDFGSPPAKKKVTQVAIVSNRGRAGLVRVRTALGHPGLTQTEETQTTVEFYDATQRMGPTSFTGAKERYQVDYEFDVV